MSIFKDLNDLRLDLSELEEMPLSKHEQNRILNKVKRKINPRKRKKKWLGVGVASVVGSVLILSLTMDKETVASMPFIGGVIERYINPSELLDYSAYKTAIGETAENALGKLTLNEVMVDDRQLFLSATFEPAENIDFDYRTHITPKVKINGKVYTVVTGGQSVELNRHLFTIYNEIDLAHSIKTDNIQLEISYDTWNFTEKIEQPWTFRVNVSQAKQVAEKKVFELNKTITLNNGDTVTVQEIVATPISTTVYYDLSQSKSENVYFRIRSKDGMTQPYSSALTSNHLGEVSFVRFVGLNFEQTKYFLIACDSKGHQLSEAFIPIN